VNAVNSDIILDRMMSLHPKIIDLTLGRVWRLLAALDHPETKLPPVIHIAGTNGKGSVQSMFRAGFEGAGQTVHAYTSPHLVQFHERIRVAGDLIGEAALTAVLDECYTANGGETITYFEITTVAAILAFARTPADWTLLEVGLGGRLDATNVVDKPALSVITPISIDHQQYLGDTLAEIAGEKAGILKPGVPCVVSRQMDEARDVIEDRAQKVGAPLLIEGQDWQAYEERGRLIVEDGQGLVDLPLPNLIGPHQIGNAGTAVVGLRTLGMGEDAAVGAVTNAYWPARMQRLTKGPLIDALPNGEIWLDGGHNVAAGKALANHLSGLAERETWLIAGMLNTKDARGFFAPLAPQFMGGLTVDIPGEAAAIPADDLANQATDAGLPSNPVNSVESAIKIIAGKSDRARVLICGSLYLAGKVLATSG